MRTLTFLLLGWWLVSTAVAAPSTVAILPIETADSAVSLRLAQALQAGVEAAPDLVDKGPVTMSLDEARMAYSCFEGQATCMAEVGALLGADRLIWGRFALDEAGRKWVLSLHLVDVANKVEIRQAQLDAKGPTDFPFLADAAQAFVLGRALEATRAPLEVRSKPSDAEVRVDGVVAGRTPIKVEVEPGMRAITVTKPGFLSEDRVVRVRPEGGVIDLDLARDVDVDEQPAVAAAGGGFGRREWITIGVGAAALASFGVAGLYYLESVPLEEDAIAAKQRGDNRTVEALRPDFEAAQSSHYLWLAVGGVLTAGAVATWFLVPPSEGEAKKPAGPTAQVSAGPGGVLVFGTF